MPFAVPRFGGQRLGSHRRAMRAAHVARTAIRGTRPTHRAGESLATASVLWWACREPEPSPLPCESSCAHFVRTLRAHRAERHGHGRLSVSRADRSRPSAEPRQSARVIRAVSARGRFSGSPTPQLQLMGTVIRFAQEYSSARPLCAPSPPDPLTPRALQTAPALAERPRDGPAWVSLRPTVSAALTALRGRYRAGGIRYDG